MEKIKNIEFLRVFLISSIVLLHMFIDRTWCLCTLFPDVSLYQNISKAIAHSNNGVEGFFIIAGFLLVLTFKQQIKLKDFILKKYIRLSPVILFSMILCFIGFLLGTMNFDWGANILTVLLVNQFGLKFVCGQNPILWFTSVLFAGLLIYFCIIKFLSSPKKYALISGMVLVSYGIIEILQHGSFANPLKNYYHFFNIGFLRAIGGIGLGCLVGFLYKYIVSKSEKNKFGLSTKIFCTLSELLLTCFVIWWCIGVHKRINNLFFVFSFALLLILFIFKKGYFSQILNKDLWVFLGRFQYSIYVIHYVVIRILGLFIWKNQPMFVVSHPILPIFFTLCVILVIGVLTYYMVELPCTNFLKQKFLRK